MIVLKIIAASLFSLVLAFFFIFLGVTALLSPQKIVDFQLKRFKRLNYFKKTNWLSRLRENYITKSDQGYYAANWRKGGGALIFVGLVFLYALIAYLLKNY